MSETVKEFEMALLVRLTDAGKLLAGRGNVPTNYMIDRNIDGMTQAVKPIWAKLEGSPEAVAYKEAMTPKPKAEPEGKKVNPKKVKLEAPPSSKAIPEAVAEAFKKAASEIEQTKIEYAPYTIGIERLPDTFGKEKLSSFTASLQAEIERLQAEKDADEATAKANKINVERYAQQIAAHPAMALRHMLGDVTMDNLFRWFYLTLGCIKD
jgi:uncharacterized small protein (DUF1192 family)